MQTYIGNFSQKKLMEKEIKSVAKNIVDLVEKDPLSLDQQIDKEIIKVMRDDPKVNSMGADEKANYLVDKLNKAGFHDLAKIGTPENTDQVSQDSSCH